MTEMANLQSIEKKIFVSYFQDGIVDLTLGLLFLFNGFMLAIGQARFAGLGVMFPLLIVPLKKSFVIPRIGYVKFHLTRKRKVQKAAVGAYIGGLVGFLVAVMIITKRNNINFMYDYAFTAMGLMISLIPLTAAVLTGVKRYYLYTLMLLTVFVAEDFTHSTAPLGFILFGSIVCISGITLLIKFLKQYPIDNLEGSDE